MNQKNSELKSSEFFFINFSPKIDSEFKNFVNSTQSDSQWAIQLEFFFIFLSFFACILDSNVLKDAHIVAKNG